MTYLPEHLLPIANPDWGLWKWFVLRAAGFPVEMASRLSDKQCAALAEQTLECATFLQNLNREAVLQIDARLAALHREGRGLKDPAFKAALKAKRLAEAGKLHETQARETGILELFRKIEDARAKYQCSLHDFQEAFARSSARQSQILWGVARDGLFQEAVLWQNRHAFETAIQPVAREAQPAVTRNQRQREREQLIASYLQRYCAKNDTIGFFGPVAWFEFHRNGPALAAAPGAALVKTRRVYFEDWAIDCLAESLSSVPGIEAWIPPRLAPYFRLEDGMLHAPGSGPMAVPPLAQAALPLCDGQHLPLEIHARIRQNPLFSGVEKQDLFELFRAMASQGVLLWRFIVPVEANSEINLRNQLLRIEDERIRGAAIEKLDMLEAARQTVGKASGNPDGLNAAMDGLKQKFEEITRSSSTRNAGATYGGRTLVYEDCQRDLELRASLDLLAPIVPPLSLLLTSLRWLMQSTSLTFLKVFRQVYREMAERSGKPDISALEWWLAAEPRLIGNAELDALKSVFSEKWAALAPRPAGARIVRWNSCQLSELVDQAFPDLPGDYHPVRYYCPDLLIAAPDIGAILNGHATYVLGEIHCGKNSLAHAALVEQHADVASLSKATEWDISSSCLKIAESRAEGKPTTRTSERILRPGDYFLSTATDAVAPHGFISHPFSGLLVTERHGQLMATTRDGSRSFDILEAFADLLFSYVTHRATWFPPERRLPRVLIDQLVIQRETWRFPVDELDFAEEKDEAERFLGLRRWAGKFALPDTVFVKIPLEVKPSYIDLSSPVYAEILCKMVRRLKCASLPDREITFCEMLPRAEDTWLSDISGAKYTSEFRFVLVDLKARSHSEEYKKSFSRLAEPSA